MNYYTRSTIIAPLTRIRRERLLPSGGTVFAKVGQEVSPVQAVARMPLKMDFQIVPVCKLLGISPDELAKHILVSKGDAVSQGDPLVAKRGLGRKAFVSPVEGTVYAVVNGRIIFRQVSDFVELRALVHGRVVNRVANRGIVLEINGSRIQAVWDSGKEGFGAIHVAAKTAVAPLTTNQLKEEITNRVLVTGKITQAETLETAQRAGVSGLIAGSITADLIPAARAVNYPVFAANGIGEQGMTPQIFQLLQESEARDVALFNSPPNHSGVRPEIIIPLEAVPGEDLPPVGRPLAPGQTVRILRPPFENRVGVVAHLHKHSQTTSIGIKAYGADIKLPDGRLVFAPIANLDAII
ncbi:MAG: hypothetical protein GY803_17100 [Chloroflexi bacterium]|nr:hypothetical protein [Chloroflexota bacterium]